MRPPLPRRRIRIVSLDQRASNRWARGVIWLVTLALAANQWLIGTMMPKAMGASNSSFLKSLFGAKTAAAKEILSTKLNADRKTTTIAAWPTVTDVPAEPKGLSSVDAAKVVMVPTGTPFYAPAGITFDDGVKSLDAWQPYEGQIKLTPALQQRWEQITGTMTCDYCCGSPTQVTIINRCGCRHAQAFRGIVKFLLDKYGDQYTNEQIIGELQRWKGVWYPKGVVEDYLLATGRGNAIGHKTHGGAGGDGQHGFGGK